MKIVTGNITEVIVRENDILISYTDDQYPESLSSQIAIQREELLLFPFINDKINVYIDNTNTVRVVFVNDKLILSRS